MAEPSNPPIICSYTGPQEIDYGGVLGSLPRTSGSIFLLILNFLKGVFGFRCSYRGTISSTSFSNPARRATINSNRFRSATFGCPEGSLKGEFTYTPELTLLLLE
jgi:hypothetical protein